MKNAQTLTCSVFALAVCLICSKTVAIITRGNVTFLTEQGRVGGWDMKKERAKEVLKLFCCQNELKLLVIKLVETIMSNEVNKKEEKGKLKLLLYNYSKMNHFYLSFIYLYNAHFSKPLCYVVI